MNNGTQKRKVDSMKMRSISPWILSVMVIGLLSASGVGAQMTTDNYSENFEGFTAGDLIIAEAGTYWSGADTNIGVVVATNYTASYKGGDFPIAYDHGLLQNTVWFEGDLTNSITAGTPSITNWVDMVLKPTFSDSEEAPALPPGGSIAGVWFNSNGTMVVSYMTNDTALASDLAWVETDVVVGENDWIRLTIAANLKDGGSPFGSNLHRFYQIYINGEVVTHAVAFQNPDRTSGGNGTWFGSPSGNAKTTIVGPLFKGTGYVDDLVVTNALQLTPAVSWTITASAGPYGSISPSGEVSVPDGGSREFTITADAGYVVGDVIVVENGGTTTNNGIASYEFVNVSADGSIHATFEVAPVVTYTIDASAGPYGSISPSGSVIVNESASQSFTITAAAGYVVADVVVLENGVSESKGAVTSYEFVNVTADGSIHATFVENPETPSGDWFTVTGVLESELDEPREPGDSMTKRQAWLASVDPDDTNSVFRVNRIWSDGGTNYIQWVSVYVDESLPPFGIWARTNLMDTTYEVRAVKERHAGAPSATPITNTWWELAPEYPVYYRVAATNAPPAP